MFSALGFLDHGGEMAGRIRSHNWAATPLGPPEAWPQALRFALNITLSSTSPSAIYWGRELRLLYNDAWAPIPADRHPWALGRPGAEVWADIWDVVGPQMEHVLDTGQGFATYDQMLMMERGGRAQETWWNYSFTPIRDEYGQVVGILNQGNETTRTVMAERARLAEVSRMRTFFEQAPGAIALLHGPDHVFEIANPAYLDLAGKTDVLGKRLDQALPELVEQGVVALLDEVFRSGIAHRANSAPILLERNGAQETRLLDYVYQPILDGAGVATDIFVLANDVTERATAEAKLRASEERLQLALDSSMGVGTWLWDVPENRVTADARFMKLYGVRGVDPDEGAPIEAFFANVHPEDRPQLEAGVAHTLRTGEAFASEYRLVQPDGSLRWVTAQGRATLDDEGRPLRFPGVSFDITERKKAEEVARDAAEELRRAHAAQAFIYALAEHQRRLDSADAIMEHATRMLGPQLATDRVGFYRIVEGGTALGFGQCWADGKLPVLTGTASLAGVGGNAVAAYRAGKTLISNDTVRDSAALGSDIPKRAASVVGVPLRRGGEWLATFYVNQAEPREWTSEEITFIEAVAEISWDAVERANAIGALRESEEKFRAIANSIDQMVWSARPDGYHDYYNYRWYEFTGVPAGTTDGHGWSDIFHPDDQARAEALWKECLETGETYRIEYRLRHHDGVYRWVLGRAQPVRDEQDRITRWFGTCTDIQEIVEARDVLARSREELETAVRDRTAKLMQAEGQLRQAQKMEAVGQLTGGIAHDFNNMLAVVIGGLDLLERRLKQGQTDVERYITAARDGATRAAALTQRLLAFSRQQPLTETAMDVNRMIDGMIELLVRTLGEDVVIETCLATDLPAAFADPNQLENCILNLAVNARDAMPGGGRLELTTAAETLDPGQAAALTVAPGAFIRISVTDQGGGMPPEVMARAFDPFFTTKGVGKGTGLGLSQVFGFIRQSGGAVRIDSIVDQGTAVHLYLPAHAGAAPEQGPRAYLPEAPRARAGEVVMVVEDEERVRTFSVEALRELGYGVIDARDGYEALRLIDRGQKVSLLFTDVVMPEMTGRELTRLARERVPELKVLLTSGYTPDISGDDGSILTKPFDLNQLAIRVRAMLDQD